MLSDFKELICREEVICIESTSNIRIPAVVLNISDSELPCRNLMLYTISVSCDTVWEPQGIVVQEE